MITHRTIIILRCLYRLFQHTRDSGLIRQNGRDTLYSRSFMRRSKLIPSHPVASLRYRIEQTYRKASSTHTIHLRVRNLAGNPLYHIYIYSAI